jgi:hypothetical protein
LKGYKVSLDAYELLTSIAAALVFVGVVGEALPQFLNFPKAERLQNLFRKISLFLLILGLAGEFLYGPRVSQMLKADTQQAIAKAAQANSDAAKANAQQETLRNQNLRLQEQLEHERTERLKLPQDVAPRYFVFRQVWPKLKSFAGLKFVIWTVRDPEAERLARLIEETLRQAGWAAISPLMIEENVNAFDEGVWRAGHFPLERAGRGSG